MPKSQKNVFSVVKLIQAFKSHPTKDDFAEPLHFAVLQGCLVSANALLMSGAYVDSIDGNGKTPLTVAVENDKPEMVKLLLQNGAKISTTELYSHIDVAVMSHSNKALKTLLMLKNDFISDKSPLLAVKFNNHDALTIFHQSIHLKEFKFTFNRTLLHHASEYGTPEAIMKLIRSGIKVDCKDDFGRTPLHFAAHHGRVNNVRILIKNGAYVNSRDHLMRTPLIDAIEGGSTEVVEVLCNTNKGKSKSSNIDEQAFVDMTEYMSSHHLPKKWERYKETLVKRFERLTGETQASSTADLITCDENGNTPLHVAARLGHVEIVKVLLKRDVLLTTRNANGETPLDVANEDVAFLLQNYDRL